MKSAKSQKQLNRAQLDKLFISLKNSLQSINLKKSWLREIRECLGMTHKQLGNRLGLEQSTVRRLEANEVKKTITLATLEKMANALDCELIYSIVPKTSLDNILQERAEKVLKHEEALLQQNGGFNDLKKEELKDSLISNLDKRLWE